MKAKIFLLRNKHFIKISECIIKKNNKFILDLIWTMCGYKYKKHGIKSKSINYYPTKNSIGDISDIYIKYNNKYYVCEPIGWKELSEEKEAQEEIRHKGIKHS